MIEDKLILSNFYYSKLLIDIYTLVTLGNFGTFIMEIINNINNEFIVSLIKSLLYN